MASDDKNLANLDLDDLRGEIDQIDQALQSLIIRRTKVVQAVGERVDTHFDRLWRSDETRESHLVFIGKDLDETLIRQRLTS